MLKHYHCTYQIIIYFVIGIIIIGRQTTSKAVVVHNRGGSLAWYFFSEE